MIFAALLPRVGATVVESGGYDVLLVDSGHPDFRGIVRSRPAGTVAIAVCDQESPDEDDVVMLRRPLHTDSLRDVLCSVRGVNPRQTGEFQKFRDTHPMALRDLAARYRFELARLNTASIIIDGQIIHLFPQKYLYVSDHSAAELQTLRGASRANIQVIADGSDAAQATAAAASQTPRRLDEFLWHLGLNAGAGQLLPWLYSDRVYRLTRWPSVVRRNNDPSQVKLATLMARRALSASELCHATGTDYESVADILNGCSVSGCLEGFTQAEAPKAVAPSAKNHGISSLLGRIRLKLGLA
jgi:hypothetical protein